MTRADARDNRERILVAAAAALSESAGASLTSIARDAGVGIGTLYRHFPTREALILELYNTHLQALVDLAPRLLDEYPPLVALRRWFGEVARYGRLKYGVAEVVHAATNGGLDDPLLEPFLDAIRTLLAAGAGEGVLKDGVDPYDVLLQLSVLWRIPPAGQEERAARILDLVVDGVRVHPAGRS